MAQGILPPIRSYMPSPSPEYSRASPQAVSASPSNESYPIPTLRHIYHKPCNRPESPRPPPYGYADFRAGSGVDKHHDWSVRHLSSRCYPSPPPSYAMQSSRAFNSGLSQYHHPGAAVEPAYQTRPPDPQYRGPAPQLPPLSTSTTAEATTSTHSSPVSPASHGVDHRPAPASTPAPSWAPAPASQPGSSPAKRRQRSYPHISALAADPRIGELLNKELAICGKRKPYGLRAVRDKGAADEDQLLPWGCYFCFALKDPREFQLMRRREGMDSTLAEGQKFQAQITRYDARTGERWFRPLPGRAGDEVPTAEEVATWEPSVTVLRRYCIECGLRYGMHRPGDLIINMVEEKKQWVCMCATDNLHPEPQMRCNGCGMGIVLRPRSLD